MKLKLLCATFAAALLSGCNSGKIHQLESDNARLTETVSNLQAQIMTNRVEFEKSLQLLQDANDDEAAGRLTHEQARYLENVLTGKIPIYKRPDGTFTTNAVE